MTAAELRALLVDRGLSRRTLAARLAVSEQCVALWAGGWRPIAAWHVADVRAALDGDLDRAARPAGAAATTVRVGTCGDDCRCARWRCTVSGCGAYWTGAAGEHVCRAVRV